jgi:hypothetical protein
MTKLNIIEQTKLCMDIRDRHVFRLWEGATKKVQSQIKHIRCSISMTFKELNS